MNVKCLEEMTYEGSKEESIFVPINYAYFRMTKYYEGFDDEYYIKLILFMKFLDLCKKYKYSIDMSLVNYYLDDNNNFTCYDEIESFLNNDPTQLSKYVKKQYKFTKQFMDFYLPIENEIFDLRSLKNYVLNKLKEKFNYEHKFKLKLKENIMTKDLIDLVINNKLEVQELKTINEDHFSGFSKELYDSFFEYLIDINYVIDDGKDNIVKNKQLKKIKRVIKY